jgi:flagellar basal body-associated protein FliL
MNLLMLILIFVALLVCGVVFYVAWRLSSDTPRAAEKQEPDDAKE